MRRNTGWGIAVLVLGTLFGCGENGTESSAKRGLSDPGVADPKPDPNPSPSPTPKDGVRKICIVSSYHREYLWSQETNRGVCQAMKEAGYLNDDQIRSFTAADEIRTPRVEIRKFWMNTKKKSSRSDIAKATQRISEDIRAFQPDLILLGDDNAANYIGNVFIDEPVPIVFWGINGRPLRYGLIDSLHRPGHNVTGVYQAGYLRENLKYLKLLVPNIRTFAILSDDSPTGRSKAKELHRLSQAGRLPVRLVETVITNEFSEWSREALRLQEEVDAFFVLNHNTIRDESGRPMDPMKIGAWYLRNIRIPECAQEKQFAMEGMLSVIDDSGFKQGYEAMSIGRSILEEGRSPETIPVRAPDRGPFIVNSARAAKLGIQLPKKPAVDEVIPTSLALEKYPE